MSVDQQSERYDPATPDGENGTLHNAISPDGTPELEKGYVIPAREGRAVRLAAGQFLKITNPAGHQVCDFFAITEQSMSEFLSMEHSRTSLGHVYVSKGKCLVTNRRRPLIEITDDSSKGVHDILIACCDLPRYRELGAVGYHDNCSDNFRMALSAIGKTATHVPSPFNIWMNIPVAENGAYSWEAPVSEPGDFVILKSLLACIAIMSACPQDMTPVNGIGTTPGPLEFCVVDQI